MTEHEPNPGQEEHGPLPRDEDAELSREEHGNWEGDPGDETRGLKGEGDDDLPGDPGLKGPGDDDLPA